LLLIVDGKTLTAVATDGHRLALNHIETDVACEHNQVIIPRKTVLELQRLLSDTDDSVQIDLADNQIRFTFGSIELLSKLVEGKFPNHERVVPKGYKNRLSINRESLQHALQRTTILPEKLKAVRLLLDAGTLKISSHNEQEEATEEIETDYTGDRIDIGFNAAYILDILSNQKSDKVVVELGDSNSSILVTFPDKTTIKHVVMPMRI
jgi:DNA polymerase-3 subunit beta